MRNIEEEEHMSLNAKINRSLTISRKPRKQRANKNRKDLHTSTSTNRNVNPNGIVKKETCQNLSKDGKDQALAQVITQTTNKAELSMILEQSETTASNGTSGNFSFYIFNC